MKKLKFPTKQKKVAKEKKAKEEDSEDEISEECPFDSDEEINNKKPKLKGKAKASLQHGDMNFLDEKFE